MIDLFSLDSLPFATKKGWLNLDRTIIWQRRWVVVHNGSMYLYANDKVCCSLCSVSVLVLIEWSLCAQESAPMMKIDLALFSIDQMSENNAMTKFELKGTRERFVFDAFNDSEMKVRSVAHLSQLSLRSLVCI